MAEYNRVSNMQVNYLCIFIDSMVIIVVCVTIGFNYCFNHEIEYFSPQRTHNTIITSFWRRVNVFMTLLLCCVSAVVPIIYIIYEYWHSQIYIFSNQNNYETHAPREE